MLRSLAVIVFIGGVATVAIYMARRPTIARGEVLAADLMKSNGATLKAMECDPEVAVGVKGAAFSCRAVFLTGKQQRLRLEMDRAGMIKQVGEDDLAAPSPRIDKTDPWSD